MRTSLITALASLTPSLVLLAAACDMPEITADPIALRPFSCSLCGGGYGNSPTVNGATLHEFSLDGTVNSDGLRILGAEFPGLDAFNVIVDGTTEQWVGLDPKNGQPKYVGAAMQGARLLLETPNGNISLEIVDVDVNVPSWGNSGRLETAYRVLYKDADGQIASLCPSLAIEDQWFTLIYGETYDTTNTVNPGQNAWVTLACVGQAAAKMKMLGYGPNGPRASTVADRQATLRMITADYCGTGHSFTTSGVPVAWRDGAFTVEPPFEETELEAKWGPDGALCLNTPRHVDRGEIDDYCQIPQCDDPEFTDAVTWRTMLP